MEKRMIVFLLSVFTCGAVAQQKQTPAQKDVQQAATAIKNIGSLFKKKNKKKEEASDGKGGNVSVADGKDVAAREGILSAGEYCTVVWVNGVLYGWGDNSHGQSGTGKSANNFSPVQITTDNDWKAISVAEYHTLGIKNDSTLWAWGWGNDSEMGLGQGNSRADYPTRVGRDTDWVMVSTSDGHSVGIRADGSLWIWGNNVGAQLGVGATPNSTVYQPYPVGRDKDWATAVAGDSFTLAIKKDGSLWVWGVNVSGDLGAPTLYKTQQAPIRIGKDNDWVKVFAPWRGYAAFGIKKDGTLWAWGSNRSYQLGLDKQVKATDRPMQVGNDGGWQSVASGEGYTVGIRSDGSMWQWGSSILTGTSDLPKPVRIPVSGRWIAVSVALNHAVAMRSDGHVYSWGGNYYGQLGVSSKAYPSAAVSSPVWVRDFPLPVITTKSKKELATIMNPETQLLFENVKSKLSIKDKNAIAKLLGFELSKDKKQFIINQQSADYPFKATVYPTDLNKDGVEEIFISYGNTFTSGLTGLSITMFIRDKAGEWHQNLNFPGLVPDVLSTGYMGYPDLLIGLPGQVLPIWRWNGKEYALSRNIRDADIDRLHRTSVQAVSKAYVNAAFPKK